MTLQAGIVDKISAKPFWKELEDALLTNLHLYSIEQICLLEAARSEIKPKPFTQRFNTLLHAEALKVFKKGPKLNELMHIIQGFRKKENKGFYM